MPFYKQPGFIIQDSLGNLHNIVWSNGSIVLTCFDKTIGQNDKKILTNNATIEFDVISNPLDEMYVLWKNNDGSINLISNQEGEWKNSVFVEPNSFRILNLNITEIEGIMHIIYCLASNEDQNTYKICHHYLNEGNWEISEAGKIKTQQILNPLNIIEYSNKLILVYYDLINDVEQVFMKMFNSKNCEWEESIQLTNSPNKKLYMDILIIQDTFHLTYCEYDNRNFIVKYEKHKYIKENISKLLEKEISNPANCSYPTLIFYENKLWNVWTEFNYLVSRYSNNNSESWSPIYVWKNSKTTNFLRYKFMENAKCINDYKFNYSFARMEDLSFIGFGSLEEAVETPIKKKRGDIDMIKSDINEEVNGVGVDSDCSCDFEVLKNNIEKLDKDMIKVVDDLESRTVEISELKEKIDNVNEKLNQIKEIDERTENIEKYLSRRSRSFKKQK